MVLSFDIFSYFLIILYHIAHLSFYPLSQDSFWGRPQTPVFTGVFAILARCGRHKKLPPRVLAAVFYPSRGVGSSAWRLVVQVEEALAAVGVSAKSAGDASHAPSGHINFSARPMAKRLATAKRSSRVILLFLPLMVIAWKLVH